MLADLSRELLDASSAQTSATLRRKSDKRNALLPTLPRKAARSDVEVEEPNEDTSGLKETAPVGSNAKSDQELFDQMMELSPRWVANQWWLMFGFPRSVTHINR
jgi:hypothetical protein